MVQSSDFRPKSNDFWPSDSQIQNIPVRFCTFGLHMQMRSFSRSENTDLKLEIEPHRNQPNRYGSVPSDFDLSYITVPRDKSRFYIDM